MARPGALSGGMQEGLPALESRLAAGLAALEEPAAPWVPPLRAPDGGEALDVAILGAGMAGLAAGLALKREGVRRVLLLDAAAPGQEGPWVTYARMRTLRSPKHLAGPALGLPALTFRAWYTAQHGEPGWEALGKIPRGVWMDYLRWYAKVAALPIRSGVRITRITPEGEVFRLEYAGGAVFARHVVLATGRDGFGGPRLLPGFAAEGRGTAWVHSADAIDFAALRGRRVAVIGAGASAFDNAAEALEAGCAALRLLVRRPALPTVNASKAMDSRGHWHGWAGLPDAWKWRLLREVEGRQTPPPRESVLRLSRDPRTTLHLGRPVTGVAADGALQTPAGPLAVDFTILGTGFVHDPGLRPELRDIAPHIRLWRDAYAPPPAEADAGLGAAPYLDAGFGFTGSAPWVGRVHCFNCAATLSLGKLSGDVPAISGGAGVLARAICARLLAADIALHWQRLRSFDTPELLGDEWV